LARYESSILHIVSLHSSNDSFSDNTWKHLFAVLVGTTFVLVMLFDAPICSFLSSIRLNYKLPAMTSLFHPLVLKMPTNETFCCLLV